MMPVRREKRPLSITLATAARGALLLLTLFMTASCAKPLTLYQTPPSQQLQWPRLSSGPRVAWVKTIATYEDAGIAKGFWKRALELVIGAEEHKITRPYGVIFDPAERLFLADPGAGVVHCMDVKQGRYSVIGGTGRSPLRTPIGVAVDGQGLLYITDSTAGEIFRYNAKDEALERFPVRGVKRPTGIVYNRVNKLLYVVDTLGSQVVAVDTQGGEHFRFGSSGNEEGQFNRPTDIAVDKGGRVYVTDALNYKIKVFSPNGEEVGRFGDAGDAMGNLNKPKGVALDGDGHIYVTDAMLDAVQVFDMAGRLLLSFGATGADNGMFWMPSGLFIDDHDYIFVTDTYNKRIQVFKYLPGTGAPAVRGSSRTPAQTAAPGAAQRPGTERP